MALEIGSKAHGVASMISINSCFVAGSSVFESSFARKYATSKLNIIINDVYI